MQADESDKGVMLVEERERETRLLVVKCVISGPAGPFTLSVNLQGVKLAIWVL